MTSSTFTGRREDRRLITGAGRYTADVNLPGQLFAAFVRADRASARIRSVDLDAARAAPGVLAAYSAADTADTVFKTPGTMVSYPGRGGQAIIVPPRRPFAADCVRYVGEEVAVVIAESAHAAEDACGLVAVDYEDLPAIAHPEDAVAPGAAEVHASVPGNVAFDFEYGNEAATTAAFDTAQHVVRLRLDSQRVAACPMEPRACLATWDAAGDSYDLYVPHQGPTMMRPGLCHILGLEPKQVRIHAQDVGGGFGARSGAYMDYVILLWAAQKLGRPLKWTGTRAEQLATEAHGRAIVIDAELALDRDGTFRAFRMSWLCDQGAYLTAAGPLINTMNGSLTIGGAYSVTAGYGRHRCVLTHTCPTGAYRGAGRPDMAYAVERLVDEAATQLGLDRLAIRRKNAIPKAAMPFTNAAGAKYDSGDFPGLLDKAEAHADWNGFAARKLASKARGKLRGLGLALFLEPSGGGAAPKDQVALRFAADGALKLHAVTQNHGQGHETVFPDLIAQTLASQRLRSCSPPTTPSRRPSWATAWSVRARPSNSVAPSSWALLKSCAKARCSRPNAWKRRPKTSNLSMVPTTSRERTCAFRWPTSSPSIAARRRIPWTAIAKCRCRAPSRAAPTSPKSKSTPTPAPPRSSATSQSMTAAPCSTIPWSKARSTAASRRGRARYSASTAFTIAQAASG